MNRAAWLLGGARPSDKIVEIGPSYSPIAPKSSGWAVHVVDHATQPDLRTKYVPMGVDVSAIEAVDSVWTGGALHEAIPAELHGGFDLLIASHVIEHLPNFVAFFSSASTLLKPTGEIALAVPDLRYCFDFFRPLSTTGNVLEAHRTNRSRHGRRDIWDQAAYGVLRDRAGVWDDNAGPDFDFAGPFEAAVEAYRGYDDDGEMPYRDCHAWQFTPTRFRLVMLELAQLGLVDWRIADLDGSGAEFLCRLRRGAGAFDAATLQRMRMDLLMQELAETQTQIGLALGRRARISAERGWGALPLLQNPVKT